MTVANLTPIEEKLLAATENKSLGWEIADPSALGPDCMAEFGGFGWQNYIPEEVRDLWAELPLSARLVAFMYARERDYFTDGPD